METNENLTEKLNFIGLDLKNIPDKFNLFQPIDFGIHKNYNEKNYKMYKYVDINDIEIFLTPTHRLTDYTEKYAKALPIDAYLNVDTEEDIERNLLFLNLIRKLNLEEIEILEEQQKALNKSIPYTVKFNKDYIWQVHYSQTSKKYFMLIPIKESELAELFYVIKKQIKGKEQKIFVPICYSEYSNTFLNTSEIEELEKFLCFFAKDWPSIYEVYDKQDNMSIQILGKATIYDTIKSEYKIELKTQGEAEDYYKLLKVLFILETQLSHHYKFNIKLDKKGTIHFYYGEDKIDNSKLIDFIKREYLQGLEKTIKVKEVKINLDKRLRKLKKLSKNLDQEYFEKEKQISTFLECKKTFFGKVKYFIKYKKKSIQTTNTNITEKDEPTNKLKYCERTEIKEVYTLEELLTLYTKLDQETNAIKDLELDIEAINKRINMLQTKIKNATLYIKEIDDHKKSIFEFWKFTNKDEAKQLNEGIIEVHTNRKLKKAFNFDLDFEDLSKQMDKEQRTVFTKEETDSIFIATTNVLNDINCIIHKEKISEEHLLKIKEEMQENEKNTAFNIFGSIDSSNEQVKTLGNIKHRENAKNKFSILNLKDKTTLKEYTNKIRNIADDIQASIKKFKSDIEIPIYKVGNIEDGLNVFYINPESALKDAKSKEVNLYKIMLKENTNCIALTNIMYYNNNNQTLPLGMHISDGILINTEKLNLKLKNKDENYIIKTIKASPKIETLKINIFEYEIC